MKVFSLVVYIALFCILVQSNNFNEPKYHNIHVHDVLESEVYMTVTQYGEIIVTYAGKGIDLRPNDYITHADGIRILSGGLSEFLNSPEVEAVVPVVDDQDIQNGGHRWIGFVKMAPIVPRKLSSRRGEVMFDLEEGGPAPTMTVGSFVMGAGGVKSTSDPSYKPPPAGGGPCITSRDCYNHVGNCTAGKCFCSGVQTGSFCQLNRPKNAAVSEAISAQIVKQAEVQREVSNLLEVVGNSLAGETSPTEKTIAEMPLENSGAQEVEREAHSRAAAETNDKPKRPKKKPKPKPAVSGGSTAEGGTVAQTDMSRSDGGGAHSPQGGSKADVPPAETWSRSPAGAASGGEEAADKERADRQEVTMEDLYGPDKAYPDPYLAGKLPNQMVHERYKRRLNRETFLYSVRFRMGPLGLSFDNKVGDGSVVEKVEKGKQADLSDIKAGDRLVAVDQFNTTNAPAKATQRIMSTLPWPRTLVFEAKATGPDSGAVVDKAKSRLFNISIIFPPTMVAEYQVRLADWTPTIDGTAATHPFLVSGGGSQEQFCPVYRMRAPEDPFGCKIVSGDADTFGLRPELDTMMEQRGFVEESVEAESPIFSMLLQEAFVRKIAVEPRSLAIVKRGVCTFVEKARGLKAVGAHLGLVVNSDNELMEMPAGKERTADCSMPLGLVREADASLTHLAARTNDIWVLVSEQGAGLSDACSRVASLAEDIVDKWPHSMPPLRVSQVLQSKAPDNNKLRGITEEGGRMALSGENGWAFFDYHLAMFGPQEVPLGPFRFQMALPPFGCDPGAYTVRIKDTVVAILRGGGCSFGIKVINAQKLGAKAVIIVNTDDMKTMRLMALPDEIPLIKIPCIMVSRRIQYYLEEQLRPYHPVDQHLVSLQPTGVFGDYEKRNQLTLPTRLSNQ